jgi:ABC-type branched-subunit amino acid transport system ATPase component
MTQINSIGAFRYQNEPRAGNSSVDQNARAALAVADRGYAMETGRIVLEDAAADLLRNPKVQQAYMGL